MANHLWIGRIPWQLQVLTFPEQLLIALLHPPIYVFKLFPKDIQYRPDASTLQQGMRGTVSTYDLDIEGAASMVQGNLMCRPASILPSVLSIMFIGRGDLPKCWLRTTFRVQCQIIFEALSWLQHHNSKYYGHITIDPDRICQLPEDDVPPKFWEEFRGRGPPSIGLCVIRRAQDIVPLEEPTWSRRERCDTSGDAIIKADFEFNDQKLLRVQIHCRRRTNLRSCHILSKTRII